MKSVLVVALVVLLWPLAVEANTYYMSLTTNSPAGSDSNTCAQAQSTATPKATFGESGGSGAISCLELPGGPHTLLIRGGTYDDNIENGEAEPQFPSGTSWTSVVRIANYNASVATGGCSSLAPRACGTAGETVWLRPQFSNADAFHVVYLQGKNSQYIEFDGINMSGEDAHVAAINIAGDAPNTTKAHHIRVKNAEMRAWDPGSSITGAGVIAAGAHSIQGGFGGGYNEFINLKMHVGGGAAPGGGYNSGWYGYYLASPNNLVEYNEIYDVHAVGIVIYNGGGDPSDNNIIRNNVIHDIIPAIIYGESLGLQITGQSTQVYNNVFYGLTGGSTGDGVSIYAGSNTLIDNNTIYDMARYGIFVDGSGGTTTGTIIRNNIVYATSTAIIGSPWTGSNNSTSGSDPHFVNASGGDFHLTASSTADIDTGVCLGSVPTDNDGTSRPQGPGCDRGAYEYLAVGALPGVPTDFVPVGGSVIATSSQAFSWTSTNTTSYDIYFGTADNLSAPLFSDNFPSATLGANWVTGFVGWQAPVILSSRVSPATATFPALAQTTAVLNPEQWASTIIHSVLGTATVYASIQVGLRTGAAPNFSGYLIGATNWAGVGCFIDRWEPGQIKTLLAVCSVATTWVDGDKLLATASRGTITGFKCNPTCTQIVQVQDATYATGRAAMALYSDNFTVSLPALDDFWAGNLGQVLVAANQAPATFTPAAGLVPGSPYYLDVIAKNAIGTADGPLQSYTASGGAAATPVGVRLRFISP